ncbi:hypothetical protein QYF36_001840 [Acer negundo]|nr:hypothetical protein QYF36_001840 [Acer negundo]
MSTCDSCGKPIHKADKSVMVEDYVYHERCSGKFTDWRKCHVCLKIIEKDHIYRTPFWGKNICNLHRFDRTPRCSICERYQNKEERYIKLADDLILCRDCHSTAIFKEDALKSLQNYLHRFFKKNNVKFHNDIPIFLVDKKDIENLASLRPPNLNLSTLTIGRAIKNRPDLFVDIVRSCKLKGSEMEVEKIMTKKLRAPWILIRYGLPR